MNLPRRNFLLKLCIALGAAAALAALCASFTALPAYPQAAAVSVQSPWGKALPASGMAAYAPYAPWASAVIAALYSLISLIAIYRGFEKTGSPEILFAALFASSLAFETTRLAVPLGQSLVFPYLWLILSAKALLFGRFFGLFSLFAAGLYASGMEDRKQGNAVLVIILAALIIAIKLPVDGLSWDSSLSLITGYSRMTFGIEAGMALVTALSFLIASYNRGEKDLAAAGIGAFLALLGRRLLTSADNWITLLIGAAALVTGTSLLCGRLHRVYLWL